MTIDHSPVSAVNASKARAILEKKIEDGRKSALALFEKINTDIPKDSIVKGSALQFAPQEKGLAVTRGGAVLGVHKHALGQLASRAGVPTAYLAELAGAGGWQSQLAADILQRHYGNGEASSRFLVRAVKGEMRGFLSDKYRRLDSRPLVEAFATECQSIGAVPVDGTFSDTRVALKAIVPHVYEPVPGEVLAFGIEWHNSDYGAGLHAIRAFILRLWCLNGATMENALAQVHLGAKLNADIELSERTYRLDTQTSVSALRDVVSSTIAPKKIEMLCEGIRAADSKKIDWKSASSKVAKKLLKGELEKARDAFEGEDTINLPAGKSVWRMSNAISWIAGQTDDADRKLELQRLAGEVLSGQAEKVAA